MSIRRALLVSIGVTAVAFLTSGLAGNHQSGLRGVVGDVSWFVFMIGTLVVIALASALVVQVLVRRTRQSGSG